MKKRTAIAVCLVGILFFAVIVIWFVGKRNKNIDEGRRLGEVLSNVEREPTDIAGIERRFSEHGIDLIEYSFVKDETNEVITRKSSGRIRMKGFHPYICEIYGWTISGYTYLGDEGEFPVFVCERSYEVAGSIVRQRAVISHARHPR